MISALLAVLGTMLPLAICAMVFMVACSISQIRREGFAEAYAEMAWAAFFMSLALLLYSAYFRLAGP